MIDKIKQGLKTLDKNVQVGICKKKDIWDCLLIRKSRIEKSGTSKLDDSFYFTISIIREDEIPEELPNEVETKMKELGFRRTDSSAKFDYTVDANEVVIEICSMEFVKAKKRDCRCLG